MTIYYVITCSMPGYLPEAEPYVLVDEQPPTGVLGAIRDEVERMAPETDEPDAWDRLLDDVQADIERAGDFDAFAGFTYRLPDGSNLEAAAQTRDELIALGYTPGEDFEG